MFVGGGLMRSWLGVTEAGGPKFPESGTDTAAGIADEDVGTGLNHGRPQEALAGTSPSDFRLLGRASVRGGRRTMNHASCRCRGWHGANRSRASAYRGGRRPSLANTSWDTGSVFSAVATYAGPGLLTRTLDHLPADWALLFGLAELTHAA